ncbi:hypothetical protein [Chloroflexus sp.]|uniref:hypothetical protein n=1 Tax=Chloroflexus sp. TaxID=1904827 RepID=UPI004049CC02
MVASTLAACVAPKVPEQRIADRADASDPLDVRLAGQGIAPVAPLRRTRRTSRTQDGRKL